MGGGERRLSKRVERVGRGRKSGEAKDRGREKRMWVFVGATKEKGSAPKAVE
jgi:hypothetical protein